jgi:hypothetical protein
MLRFRLQCDDRVTPDPPLVTGSASPGYVATLDVGITA